MFKTKNSFQLIIIIFLCLLVVPVSFAQETETIVRIMPVNAEVGVSETIQVAIEIVDVSELYGASVTLNFDPDVLNVVDANPELEGVQVAFGTFLDPGFVMLNTADNTTGTLSFAMTQLNPTEPKNGTGIFIVITFLSKQVSANTPVILADAQLGTRLGTEILTQVESGALSIVVDTPSGPTRTPIPIQLPGTPLPDSTDNLVTNTPRPTATAGETNDVTNTPPVPTATAVSTNTVTTNNQPTVASTSITNPTQQSAATALPTTSTTTSTDSVAIAIESVSTTSVETETTDADSSEVGEAASVAATAVSAINPTIGSNTNNANQSAVQTIGEDVQPAGTAVATTNAPADSNPIPFVMALLVSLVVVLIIAVIIIQRRQSRSQG